ncbi:hypothetical protein OPQ81_000233 [Rhizoctonia solani]|nr:hypothetical protein OPQ81_000233 [Rhizoctonia solani]
MITWEDPSGDNRCRYRVAACADSGGAVAAGGVARQHQDGDKLHSDSSRTRIRNRTILQACLPPLLRPTIPRSRLSP